MDAIVEKEIKKIVNDFKKYDQVKGIYVDESEKDVYTFSIVLNGAVSPDIENAIKLYAEDYGHIFSLNHGYKIIFKMVPLRLFDGLAFSEINDSMYDLSNASIYYDASGDYLKRLKECIDVVMNRKAKEVISQMALKTKKNKKD